jgi:uncharacterized protein (DUF1697 family)
MRYLALLRAINVGGRRIVKMDALRQSLAAMGLSDIQTFIQSGNVIFEAGTAEATALQSSLEQHLAQSFGFEIPVTLRSAAELESLVQVLPEAGPAQRLYVYFLGQPHAPEAQTRLKALEQSGLSFSLRPRELLLSLDQGLKDKRLDSPQWLERQVGSWLTARNDRTTRKLAALIRA